MGARCLVEFRFPHQSSLAERIKYPLVVIRLDMGPVDHVVHAVKPSVEQGWTFREDDIFLQCTVSVSGRSYSRPSFNGVQVV